MQPVDTQRRRFMQIVGMAGLASSAAGARSAATAAATAAEGDFPAPPGLRPGAQLDSRFPVSFAESVPMGLTLVTRHFTALSRRDPAGLADTLHFPFAIYEDIEPIVVESRREFLANPPPTLNGTGRGESRIEAGAYDLLESVDVHLYCPVGGVFSLAFSRYTRDGHKLLDCEGVYSVTNNDGRWAIQLASTIFHERGYEKLRYPDAATAQRVGSQGYLAAFGYRDEALLNDLDRGRGSYEPRLPVGTRVAGVSFGYGPRDRSRNARENHPCRAGRPRGSPAGWRYRRSPSRAAPGRTTPASTSSWTWPAAPWAITGTRGCAPTGRW